MLQRLRRISAKEWALFIEAWMVMHVSRCVIVFLPFRWLAPLLGKEREEAVEDPGDAMAVMRIAQSIDRAAARAVYRSRCFDQALTAVWMLRVRRIAATLFLGAAQQEGVLSAHAWVRSGSRIVTGSRGMKDFTPVARYRISGPVQFNRAS